MRNYFILFGLFLINGFVFATEPMWIIDRVPVSISDAPNIHARFVGTVPAGESVTWLENSNDGRYSRIKYEQLEGWIYARYLTRTPSVLSQYPHLNNALKEAQAENVRLSTAQENKEDGLQELQEQLRIAKAQLEQVSGEYAALQRASANVVAIDQQNRRLQAQLVALEQKNLHLTHSNIRLSESDAHRQLISGGLLVIGGFLLHWFSRVFFFHGRRSSIHDL